MSASTAKALAALAREVHGPDDVHQVRLTTKRLRALWQILRPVAEPDRFRTQNRQMAGAARLLAADRDAFVLRGLLVELREQADRKKQRRAIDVVLERLRTASAERRSPLRSYREFLQQRLRRMAACVEQTLDPVRDAEVFFEGAEQTYARARKHARKARGHRDAVRYHRWRKWVKYLYYQLEMLQPRTDEMKSKVELLDALGKTLGSIHDMANLRAQLSGDAWRLNDERAVRRVRKQARARENELMEHALELADQVFDPRPETFRAGLRKACS